MTVKDLLGHSNISTTMRYAHSNDEAKRRAVQRLDKAANDNAKPDSDKVVTAKSKKAVA